MPLTRWWTRARELAGAAAARGLSVGMEEWRQAASDVAAAGGRLLAMWAADGNGSQHGTTAVYAAFIADPGVLLIELPLERAGSRTGDEGGPQADYPGLAGLFPCASRMQRAMLDLSRVRSSDPDQRPWLHHAREGYDFVRVSGDGVHEVAVGPVHAGTIEPGHFRFSVVGEKVLRLEERLGYTHKGVERRFTELPILEGHRLAARLCGDSAVAYSWAYCQALEGMTGCEIPPRAAMLRALFLELERIANHLGDIGGIANDAGLAFGLSQFSRLKEELLRAVSQAFDQRYLLDAVVPGGTRVDLSAPTAEALSSRVTAIAVEASELRAIYDDHSGLRERFAGAGLLTVELATRLGVLGLVGRASGQALDARVDRPWAPYGALAPRKVVLREGDVAARVAVRFEELTESCRLVLEILASLPAGANAAAIQPPQCGAFGVGLIEGWRGPVLIALEAGRDGTIHRCHPHDPSWQNWPALEHAILGNLIADFPLINRSFNLAYSGVDL
ncbi:MAG: Ni,Fe-hydrogenase III large subunit [Steroidobacteraceae bacterium]